MLKQTKYRIGDKQRACYLICLTLVALLQINLVGCVIVPIPTTPEKAPFGDDLISSIKTGITTKETVKDVLGEPNATRQNDSVYVYANAQKIGRIIAAIPFGTGFYGAPDWNKDHLLIIQFTNGGIVKEVNHIVGTGSQTKDGIYVADTGLRGKGHKLFEEDPAHPPFDRLLLLYAPRNLDERAKEFLVPPKKSVIYLFRRHWRFFNPREQTISGYVCLDNTVLGDCGGLSAGHEGYYYWVVDPGVHILEGTPINPPRQYVDARHLSIDCQEGRAYFVEQTWEEDKVFTELDKDRGQKEIRKRRLILDRFNPFE
jgi:hypothetical protein